MSDHDPLTVSIVVCTQNRSSDLEDTCRCLLHLASDPNRCEVLVVDNGSTDGTPDVTSRLSQNFPNRFRVVSEPESGLSVARNTGIVHSRGNIIIFIDDDAKPTMTWLDALLWELEDPSVWSAGGPVTPVIAAPYPPWFSALYLPYLSAWDLGDETLDLSYNEYPRGTNIAFKRHVFDSLGMFLPQLGRRGRSLRSCEEIELCLRVERAGGRIRYVPEARVSHKVDLSRLTGGWMVDRFKAQGFSEAITEWHHAGAEGLTAGLRRSWINIRQHSSRSTPTDTLMGKCSLGALKGYCMGSLYAVIRIGRYQTDDPNCRLRPWSPS